MTKTKTYFQALLGALVWITLILQFPLTYQKAIGTGNSPLESASHFFGYFTILSNLSIALLLTISLLFARSTLGKFFARPGVASAVMVYIFIVAVVYHALLRSLWDPQGIWLFCDTLLHTVNPIVYAIFWATQVDKRSVTQKNVIHWLIFPLIYVAYCFIHGAFTHYYPYPFLDAGKLGYPQVSLICVGFLLVFYAVGTLVVWLGKKLPART